ncbi:MAG: rhodanese-like domain-containing protein [Nocardioides sp.]
MQEIDITEAATAHENGATFIDVREPSEYADGHVPGARNIPMGQVNDRIDEVDRSSRVHVVCASGNRSGVVTEQLISAGYDAVNVQGGTSAWIESGRPVEK